MKPLALFLLGLLTLALMAPPSGKLAGTVTAASGEVLSDVEIVIDGTTHTTRSDSLGRYYILAIPDGQYQVSAHHAGYASMQVDEVKISSLYTTELNFALEKRER